MPEEQRDTWFVDQLTKAQFFHQKLHLWGLLSVADAIEEVRGEDLPWDLQSLEISEKAWNKVIHRGIKPIRVFAHPSVLSSLPRAVGYYRMLAIVSQKSMKGVGLSVEPYEDGRRLPDVPTAEAIAKHLNRIISQLVETDPETDAREFDLWRAMTAGAQAQGSWVNAKGDIVQATVNDLIQKRLTERSLLEDTVGGWVQAQLRDGRLVTFGDDPDILFRKGETVRSAIEVKGGIDPAGVLERLGAALKSLSRIREEHPAAVTILILRKASLTEQAERDLNVNRHVVTNWFLFEDLLVSEEIRSQLFDLLDI